MKPNLIAAKEILKSISDNAENKLLLIGGLAVNQYNSTRNSQDIDLICKHDECLDLIKKVFKTHEWDIIDKNNDSLHPQWEMTHKTNREMPVIKFGPKIIERHLTYIDKDKLWENAKPFKFRDETYPKIYVPTIEIVCYTKIVSILGRTESMVDKIKKDIEDVINLSNHSEFGFSKFIILFEKELKEKIKVNFSTRIKLTNAILKDSHLYQYVDLFKSILDTDNKSIAKPSRTNVHPVGVVAFDVDGVLIKKIRHSWTLLWNTINGDLNAHRARKESFQNRKISYLKWVEQDQNDLKKAGFNIDTLRKTIKEKCALTKNLREAVNKLRDNGYITAIISGGVDTVLTEMLPDVNTLFDEIYINRFFYDENGFLERISATEYDWDDNYRGVAGKNRGLERICEKYRVSLQDSVFVGDDSNDLKAMNIAGRKIIYCNEGVRTLNPEGEVISIYDDDLMKVADAILGIEQI